MYCNNCGAKLEENAVFCGRCGNRVGEESGMEKNNVNEISLEKERNRLIDLIKQIEKKYDIKTEVAKAVDKTYRAQEIADFKKTMKSMSRVVGNALLEEIMKPSTRERSSGGLFNALEKSGINIGNNQKAGLERANQAYKQASFQYANAMRRGSTADMATYKHHMDEAMADMIKYK